METETTETAKVKLTTAEQLGRLGFKKAAKDLGDIVARQRKLALAYEHYRYVLPEHVRNFNAKLLAKTGKNMNDLMTMEYQALVFTPIKDYEKVPPQDVLEKLETAQERKCFDSFEVAYIKNVKDPLLFGRISKCPSRFFIAQWDDDVSINDLLKENEG